MSQFNLGQFLTKVVDYSLSGIRGNSTESMPKPQPQATGESFSQNLIVKPQPQPQVIIVTPLSIKAMPMQNMEMNHLEALDKALYVKDLMNLPKEINELLDFVQKNTITAKELSSLLTSSLDLGQISLLLQKNGKEAVNKLIMAMSNASKQGITDLSMMKETMKLINLSVSLAEKNPSQVAKSLTLLYLPWLPLQEGVDFEYEIENSEEQSSGEESSITIMISTKNYGNLRITLVLLAGNSITVLINCSDVFPKEELLKRIKAESAKHSVQPSVMFETKAVKQNDNVSQQAKMNASNASQVSPLLLLMAHSIIRHTIELDNAVG